MKYECQNKILLTLKSEIKAENAVLAALQLKVIFDQ